MSVEVLYTTDGEIVHIVESETISYELAISTVHETALIQSYADQRCEVVVENNEVEIVELCSPCPGVKNNNGPTTIAGGALFASNITPTSGGLVSIKEYLEGTIPSNSIIAEATTDTDNVRIYALVEGNSAAYTPTVTIDGIDVDISNYSKIDTDSRSYVVYQDIVVTESRVVELESSTGQEAEVYINRAAAGPAITAITFGSYPGSQTELKAGDTIQVIVTTEESATSVTFYSFGAVNSKTLSVSGGIATGTLTVSNNTGTLSAKAYATNGFGTDGNDFTSADTLELNQTKPSISNISISYPISQSAIKDAETVNATSTVTDFSSINYTNSNDLSITESTSSYDASKTVSRVSGSYVVSGTNYTVTAYRAANGSSATKSALIKIVNVPATASISIDGSPSRLRSRVGGKNYTVRVNANQQIQSYNSLDTDKGTFGSFSSNRKVLTIEDSTARGTGTFSNLSVTGLSGIEGTVITSGENYEVGGFELREIQYPAGSTHEPIGTYIADANKIVVKLKDTVDYFTYRTNTDNFGDGFTITNSDGTFNSTGNYLYLTSQSLTGSNSSGLLIAEIEEVV